MTRLLKSSIGLGLLLALALAPAASAASRNDEPLSLVPSDAASLAVIHMDQLRGSSLADGLFADTDRMAARGDAARFLSDANLSLKKDVDTVVVASVPAAEGKGQVLAIVTGRFDPASLAKTLETRGAEPKSSPAGNYELLPQHSDRDGRGALAIVNSHLLVAGSEPAVLAALSARQAGGTRFTESSELAHQLSRVRKGAAAWILVDVARYPALQKSAPARPDSHSAEPAMAVFSAMKSVTVFEADASPSGEGLELEATGLVKDPETRQLLEDSLRGMLAMWRLAVGDKSPELVTALRKFEVGGDSGSVTIHGTLPASALRSMAEKHAGGAHE